MSIFVRSLVGPLVGVLFASAALADGVHGDDAGKRLYAHYCSSCHGKQGKGDGSLAPILAIEPADLTQLARERGEDFSFLTLLRSIDGRATVRGHGSRDMPVWGEVLGARPGAPMAEQLRGAGKLLLITEYVESLQEK